MRGDVGERLARELGSLATVPGPVATDATSAQTEAGPFLEALAADSPIRRSWIGPAFAFQDRLATSDAVEITTANASLLRPYLVEWLEDVSEEVPMCVSLVEGRAVSICCSVRATDGAHEAGVETHPRFRRRGHAARAVLGWAVAVRIRGLEPLYSTSWENEASLGLAAALGLLQYGADLHVT